MLRAAATAVISASLILSTASPALAADEQGPAINRVFAIWEIDGIVGPHEQLLRADISDASGVDKIAWWIDGVKRAERDGVYGDSVYHDFGSVSRVAQVEVRAWDVHGNYGSRTFPMTVDADPPTVTSAVPGRNARVRGTTVTATLNLADKTKLPMYVVPGTDLTKPLGGMSPFTAKFPIRADGPTHFGWWVYDPWGNMVYIEQPVVADNSGPSVGWLSPRNNALIRGSRIVSGVRATDGAGVRSVTLSGATADTTAPYASSIAAGKDGRKTLTWTVLDKLGNRTVVKRIVIVDNTAPSVKVTKAPKNKAKVKGTVKITAAASDKYGVARVELLVNGKVVAKDTKVVYRFSLNTRKYGKKIKIQLRAYDKAGNMTKTSTRTWFRS